MTTNLSNEYEKLLAYLSANLPETPTKQKSGKPVNSKAEIKKDSKKVAVEKSTQQLIEDSKIHSYIPPMEDPVFQQYNKSVGFDVVAFEKGMRQKLIEEYKKSQTYERPYISVTEICNCIRSNFYNRMKYKVDLKKKFNFSYLYLIQRVGNEIHNVVQGLYNFNETEKTIVSETYKVKGRVDGIRESYLYELKSIDEDKLKGKYKEEHYHQGIIYAYILNTEYEYKIKKIVIVYFIRNLKKVIPFDLPLDDSLAKSLLERAITLKSSININEVPDPIGATNDQCYWCLYKTYCEKDQCQNVLQPWKKSKKVKTEKEAYPEKVTRKKREAVFLL